LLRRFAPRNDGSPLSRPRSAIASASGTLSRKGRGDVGHGSAPHAPHPPFRSSHVRMIGENGDTGGGSRLLIRGSAFCFPVSSVTA
jgi:hypothetical protein